MRDLILVRGGGDIATGTIWTLRRAGFPVLILESANPSAIRRSVSFCEAVYTGEAEVEGMKCVLAKDEDDARRLLEKDELAVLVDPEGKSIGDLKPAVLVDAILAKKNLGTGKDMAPFVLALGPGFTAGTDCHAVVETMRGHDLARLLTAGSALPNTGTPGLIAGHASDRVIHASCAGVLYNRAEIGDIVKKDRVIAVIRREDGTEEEVKASFTGLLRGLIRNNFPVAKGFKIADIDPRETEYRNCFTISDKARAIGGTVLMAVMEYRKNAHE